MIRPRFFGANTVEIGLDTVNTQLSEADSVLPWLAEWEKTRLSIGGLLIMKRIVILLSSLAAMVLAGGAWYKI